MSISRACKIYGSRPFERTYTEFKSKYYLGLRLDPASLAEDVEAVMRVLAEHPISQSQAYRRYRWPKKSEIPGMELWRYRFNLHAHRGDSGQGRLMYLFHPAGRAVHLLWLYNHDQHVDRPPDNQIKAVLRDFAEGDH